jgi:membrane fusion protein, multidrug efflux system
MNKLSILFIFALAISCGKRGKKENQAQIIDDVIMVKTEVVTNVKNQTTIDVTGLVASLNESRLSFKTGGIIEKIYVKEGQNVQKGQLLASLNLTEISANVQQAKEAVNKSERDLRRITSLYADSVSTLEQVQNLTTALSLAKQNLQIAQFNQSYSKIHAPISGTIVKKIMNEGELCGPGNPVFFMNSTASNSWILKAGITDQDWARTKIGDKAEVEIGAFQNENFEAKINNLSQAPDPNSGLYQVEISINPNGKKLATGLFGKAKVYPAASDTKPSISINSLIEGNQKNAFVYIISPDSRAKKIPVSIHYISNGRVFLNKLPDTVNQVITDGSAYLVDGSKVKLAK